MTRVAITPDNDEHWHALRAKDITSTECAALFNRSPWNTRFELWHQKKAGVPVSIDDNERMEVGREMEPVIARLFSNRYGVKIRALNKYIYDTDDRIGASFDFEIVGVTDWTVKDETYRDLYRQHGAGNLECKNVDFFIHNANWNQEEAPDHIEIQVQHQLEVYGRAWGVICPLIGGNRLAPIWRLADERFGQHIRTEARKFWLSVHAGDAPEAVMPDDAEAVISMYQHAEPGSVADLRENADADALAAEYTEAHAMMKDAEERKRSAQAQLLMLAGEAERVITTGYKLSCGPVAPSQGKLITPEMVGEYVGGRRGFRNFRLTKLKEKENTNG